SRILACGSGVWRRGRWDWLRTRSQIFSGEAQRQTTRACIFRLARLASRRIRPPPAAITAFRYVFNSWTTTASHSRNLSSPSSAKMRAIDLPASDSTRSSVSTNRKRNWAATSWPTEDLPVPMKPTNARFRIVRAPLTAQTLAIRHALARSFLATSLNLHEEPLKIIHRNQNFVFKKVDSG